MAKYRTLSSPATMVRSFPTASYRRTSRWSIGNTRSLGASCSSSERAARRAPPFSPSFPVLLPPPPPVDDCAAAMARSSTGRMPSAKRMSAESTSMRLSSVMPCADMSLVEQKKRWTAAKYLTNFCCVYK
ncbi:hypothetical protein DQ04_06681010 [Trypanosoma grayi]|uniref:hypothetical protein n=1 Tax=Trypanosoma grayi TaxID=71804 RepID=UPI0004F459EA|nr:hypothetical protein DQ04_06681010 [Trypanosoma grayi]KEG08663.1 hypothetical protein DQ04_06681010 [Trypanosoma grayi]